MSTHVGIAANHSMLTAMPEESTAATSAISLTGSEVDLMSNEMLYQTTMHIVRSMLEEGIITADEYSEMETVFLEKYKPTLGVLFSSLSLDYLGQQSDV